MFCRTVLSVALSLLVLAPSSATAGETDLMVVFDASGSMWGQINGTAKIKIAQDAFSEISKGWQQSGQSAGLIAYGHRRKGDCGDIELLSSPSPAASSAMSEQVVKLSPKGKTPLSAAVRMAAEELKFTENPATVILLSDGIETCNMDPCAVGTELESLGIDFTAHVIGFDIKTDADRAQLQCLAANTGGQYLDANNADDLSNALTRVSEAPPADPMSTVTTQIVLAETEGTARPAQVTLEARRANDGETRELGVLQGAEQVITGLSVDLPTGTWIFSAKGDGGEGEVTVDLTEKTSRITIPFDAGNAVFEYLGPQRFVKGEDITFQLRSRKPLQENATFYAALVPAGATSFDENISFIYRFGTDPKTTEHVFNAWEYPLEPGRYDIVLQTDGNYDLNPNLGRFTFEVMQEDTALETEDTVPPRAEVRIVQQFAPLSPGVTGAFLVEAHAPDDRLILVSLEGSTTRDLPLNAAGLVDLPSDVLPGTYDVTLTDANGIIQHTSRIDILPLSSNDMGDHADPTSNANTPPPLDVWRQCNSPIPCDVTDPRVDLAWRLPGGWVTEEPFYYTTAGGIQAKQPTLIMGRDAQTGFRVALNPRQWSAALGPCEDSLVGTLCRENSEEAEDLRAYTTVRDSLLARPPFQEPPLARTFTATHADQPGAVALLHFAETTSGASEGRMQLLLMQPDFLGVSQTGLLSLPVTFQWDPTDGSLRTVRASGTLSFEMIRPEGWDRSSNVWTGQIGDPNAQNQTQITIF